MAIAESIQLNKIDEMLQAQSVAELTETTQMAEDVIRMEIDAGAGVALRGDFDTEAWKYTDQRYGNLLTGSSQAAREYVELKQGYVDIEGQPSISNNHGISLAQYLLHQKA